MCLQVYALRDIDAYATFMRRARQKGWSTARAERVWTRWFNRKRTA